MEEEVTERKTNEKILQSLIRLETKISELEKVKGTANENTWGLVEEAMTMLKITSKTTMHKIKMTGAIRTARLSSKLELYYLPDIDTYLKKLANIKTKKA